VERRRSTILSLVFGHSCVILGCYLIALGIYVAPLVNPTPVEILTTPLFWGLVAVLGGVCSNFNAVCRCARECLMKRGGCMHLGERALNEE